MFVFVLLTGMNVRAVEESPPVAQSLGYGLMLYQYFQQHHFKALTEYAIAAEQNNLEGHGSNPELMQGGISLAFGMDEQAASIFNSLLEGSYSKGIESQAWFYLGKIAYQRGNFLRATQVLSEVSGFLPHRFQDEYRSLVSQLALRDNNFTHAEAALARITEDSAYKAYTHFNIGAAYQKYFIAQREAQPLNNDWYPASIKLDAAAEAALRLDYAGVETIQDDEFKALADRALLASAYALLQGKRYDAAIDRFKRVRLKGPYTSQAMLGYGWAEVEQENYKAALTPWQHLLDQTLLNSAVQEAYVGIPYVYEKLGATSRALEGFELAAVRYREELQQVIAAIDTLREISVSDLFVVDQSEGFKDWVAAQETLTLNPQRAYLVELLAGHAFQSILIDLRDLYALRSNLESWQSRLATFEVTLDSRHKAREDVRKRGKQELLDRVTELASRRAVLHTKLAERLGREQRLNDARPEQGVQAHKQLHQQMHELDAALDQMTDRKISVEQLLASNLDVKASRARIAESRERLSQALLSNTKGIARAEQKLSDMAIAKLSLHYHSIESQLTHTQLAITRLYDQQIDLNEQALPAELESQR